MFDTIGRDTDDEATRRSLASLLITTILGGAATSFVLGFGAMTVVTAAQVAPPDDDGFTEYVPVDLPPQLAAPPPPPPAAAAPQPTAEPDRPQPDEPDERVAELKPVVPEPLRDAQRPTGQDGGTDGGEEGGKLGGTVGGDPQGTALGGPPVGAGLRLFHHSELDMRSRPSPRYPRHAASLGLDPQACTVDVSIDERGHPFDLEVRGCHEVFAEETRRALLRWRWYPPKRGRDRIKARTTVRVLFQNR